MGNVIVSYILLVKEGELVLLPAYERRIFTLAVYPSAIIAHTCQMFPVNIVKVVDLLEAEDVRPRFLYLFQNSCIPEIKILQNIRLHAAIVRRQPICTCIAIS